MAYRRQALRVGALPRRRRGHGFRGRNREDLVVTVRPKGDGWGLRAEPKSGRGSVGRFTCTDRLSPSFPMTAGQWLRPPPGTQGGTPGMSSGWKMAAGSPFSNTKRSKISHSRPCWNPGWWTLTGEWPAATSGRPTTLRYSTGKSSCSLPATLASPNTPPSPPSWSPRGCLWTPTASGHGKFGKPD